MNVLERQTRGARRRAFTLTEMAVSTALTVAVFTVTLPVFVGIHRSWYGIELRMQADRDVNLAMNRLVHGTGGRLGLRSAAGVTVTSSSAGWTLTYGTGGTTPQTNTITYGKTNKTLVFTPGSRLLGDGITLATAIAKTQSVVLTLRVERVDGPLRAVREIGTEVAFRNR